MNLPEDFKKKYTRLLGQEATDFFNSFETVHQKGYRLNPLKANPVPHDTPNDGKVPYGQWGYFGSVDGHSKDHVTGVVYSQEPSAQFVGEVAAPKPGEKVLDLAAAPGGKSTHLAAFMMQKGLLWSNEIFMSRAKILSENIERLGVQNAIVSSQTPAELSARLPLFFDKILLDAPCSGEGMFRKDPDAMAYWHSDYPAENAQRQREILHETVKMLRPGGELVYSTCTFSPEEDEQMIAWLLDTYPEFELLPIDKSAGSGIANGRPEWADSDFVSGVTTTSQTQNRSELLKTARLWPHHLNGEGHFVAKLIKKSTTVSSTETVIKKLKPAELNRDQKQLIADFWESTFQQFDIENRQFLLFGDRLFLAPESTPDLNGLRILRPGLEIGSFKKNRFEPAHALALAVSPSRVKQQFNLVDQDWADYAHGDVISTDEPLSKGWILMVVNGNGAGWGKFVNGQIKNFLPKGLRFAVRV